MNVLVTDYWQADVDLERSLFAAAGVEMTEAQCETSEQVIEAGGAADAFIVGAAPVTRAVFEALPRLRMISGAGTGIDTIDSEAAHEHGVWVSNSPGANTGEVATHALGMALALIRHLPFYDRSIREGHWDYENTGPLPRPATLTLGVVGLGRIGQRFVSIAAPCFGQVLGHDPYLTEDEWPHEVRRATLDELFQQSDIVSLHVPLTDENANMVDRARLSQMRRGSFLVNVSRGGLVDLDGLRELLDNGAIAGAALDVMPQEPPPPDHPILLHPRILTSPHAAGYSTASEEEQRRTAVNNVLGWLASGTPPNVVVEGKFSSPG
jgi:D-3-phosphoglycerate dehydrogenase